MLTIAEPFCGDRLQTWPEKTPDISRLHRWFSGELTTDERAQKFHTLTCHYPNLASASDWLKICFNQSNALLGSG